MIMIVYRINKNKKVSYKKFNKFKLKINNNCNKMKVILKFKAKLMFNKN